VLAFRNSAMRKLGDELRELRRKTQKNAAGRIHPRWEQSSAEADLNFRARNGEEDEEA
jgi:hypothetical protein